MNEQRGFDRKIEVACAGELASSADLPVFDEAREVMKPRDVISLAILFRWRVSNPLLIAATAVVGMIAYPILQPGWVMVH